MLTDLYLQTTNPKLSMAELLDAKMLSKIVLSVLFHTTVYVVFLNLVSYVFLGKTLSSAVNTRAIVCLVIIMFFGFFARFYHVKEIYGAYGGDLAKTRAHLDKLYIGWIFLS